MFRMLEILLLALGVSATWARDCFIPMGVHNHAKHGVASQSSVYEDRSIYPGPDLAIDGNHDSVYKLGSCMHTKNDHAPWWSMDMRKSVHVGTVALTNRMDCCQNRLLGAEVRVGSSPDVRKQELCGVINDVSSEKIPVCCDGKLGRYVTVTIPSRKEYLTLCEVEIFAHIESHNKHPEDVAAAE